MSFYNDDKSCVKIGVNKFVFCLFLYVLFERTASVISITSTGFEQRLPVSCFQFLVSYFSDPRLHGRFNQRFRLLYPLTIEPHNQKQWKTEMLN